MMSYRILTAAEIITFLDETDDEAREFVWIHAKLLHDAGYSTTLAFSNAIHLAIYGE